MGSPVHSGGFIGFQGLINKYSKAQSNVAARLDSLANKVSGTNPGEFLLMQFDMAKITQVGDSVSNFISVLNSMINNAVRNQKP